MTAEALDGETYFRHETAVVDSGARIGAGVRIWHHAHIRSGAVVGPETQLGKNVYVDEGALIGGRAKIQNNVSVYRGVVLEDDVFVGPSAVFTNDRVPRAFGDWVMTTTLVRRGASIGANATIVCGVQIGEFAMVAAGAVVTRAVSDHQLVGGNPAGHLGWVCGCGAVVSREAARPIEFRCADCRSSGRRWP